MAPPWRLDLYLFLKFYFFTCPSMHNHFWKTTHTFQMTLFNTLKFSSHQILSMWFKKPQSSVQGKQHYIVFMFRKSQKLLNEVTAEGFKQETCCFRCQKLQWSYIGCETKDLFLGRKGKGKKCNWLHCKLIYISCD